MAGAALVSTVISIILRLFIFYILLGTVLTSNDYYEQRKVYDGFWQMAPASVTGPKLTIYCYAGKLAEFPKYLPYLWIKPVLLLNITSEDFSLFRGTNTSDVADAYEAFESSWINPTPLHARSVAFPAFRASCIGVAASARHDVDFRVIPVDPVRLLSLIAGLLLFFSAGALSRNVVFYYSSGITIGVLASLLIIVFLVSRFIPKKVGAYSVLVGGSSVVVYFFRFLWENISIVLQAYMIYVAAYVAIAATISFAVCYRKGPVTDARSLDLIQWAMQAVALAAVYYGTQVDEVSVGIVLAVIAMRVLPAVPCGGFVTKAWRRRFPPKPRLLTEEEYQQQGEEETRRALEELRRYCQSPACSPWKTVGQLKTPSKFASFIEGDAHVSSSEEEEYYRDVTAELDLDLSFTEDEDD